MSPARLTLVFLALLGGCATSPSTLPRGEALRHGDFRLATEVRFGLVRREYLLHIPSGFSGEEPRPLVVVLHGAFSNANQTAEETGFSALADREGFLVAYPEGIGLFGWLQHWNAGHCCGKAMADGVDDVGYVTTVVDSIRQRLPIDDRRIYLAGMSNGGMLTYRLIAERPELFAAAAVVSGAMNSQGSGIPEWSPPMPRRGVPLIIIHGDADQHVPPAGGVSPLKGGERRYLPLAEAAESWRERNGCGLEPRTSLLASGALRRRVWEPCDAALEVWQLADWGHQWPAPHFTNRLPSTHPLHGLDGTAMIWDFFAQRGH